jgi:rhodanese-related sulfurtransferase
VALRLIEMGYHRVYALKGGWIEWEKAKYPIEKK